MNEMNDRPRSEQRNDGFGGLGARRTEVRGKHDIAKGHLDVRVHGEYRTSRSPHRAYRGLEAEHAVERLVAPDPHDDERGVMGLSRLRDLV